MDLTSAEKHMRAKEVSEPIIKRRSMMAKVAEQTKTALLQLLPEAAVHKISVLKDFAKLTGKHLCLFSNKGAG